MPTDQDLERQISRMDAEAKITHASERLKFQQQCALATIKSLTIVNGGAILSLLTFIGNNNAHYDVPALRQAFEGFGLGLVLALASYIAAYHSESWYMHSDTSDSWNYQDDMRQMPRRHHADANKERRRGWLLQIAAIGLVTGSLPMFIYGCFRALTGILG